MNKQRDPDSARRIADGVRASVVKSIRDNFRALEASSPHPGCVVIADLNSVLLRIEPKSKNGGNGKIKH